jgi:hypothetical protein
LKDQGKVAAAAVTKNEISLHACAKSVPLLQADACEKCLDSTHVDINCGSFFKKT